MPTLRSLSTGRTIDVTDEQLSGGAPLGGGSDIESILAPYIAGAQANRGTTAGSRFVTQGTGLKKLLETEEEEEDPVVFFQNALAVLEQLWFSAEEELAGTGGSKISRKKQQADVWIKASEAFTLYDTFKKTMGATLAKKAGDTGNIAWNEQLAQLNALPVPGYNTKPEGQKMFTNVRVRYGESPGPGYYDKLRKGDEKVEKERKPFSVAGLTFGEEGEGVTPPTGDRPGDTLEAGMPNLPYGAIGGLGSFFKNPALAALIGGGGNVLQQVKEKGIPLTREAGERDYGIPGLEMLLGPLGSIAAGTPSQKEALGAATKTGLLSLLLHPTSTLGGLRNIAAGSQTVPASTITGAGKQFLSRAGQQGGVQIGNVGATQRAIAEEPAKGALNLIKTMSARGKAGFGGSGASAPQLYNQHINRVLRELLSQRSPVAGALTTGMGKIANLNNILKQLLKIGTYGAVGAGAAKGAGILPVGGQ